jgi:hypothetical protein
MTDEVSDDNQVQFAFRLYQSSGRLTNSSCEAATSEAQRMGVLVQCSGLLWQQTVSAEGRVSAPVWLD